MNHALPSNTSMRRGKWIAEEVELAEECVKHFLAGFLPKARALSLRSYIAGILACDPMRVSKRFSGFESVGKVDPLLLSCLRGGAPDLSVGHWPFNLSFPSLQKIYATTARVHEAMIAPTEDACRELGKRQSSLLDAFDHLGAQYDSRALITAWLLHPDLYLYATDDPRIVAAATFIALHAPSGITIEASLSHGGAIFPAEPGGLPHPPSSLFNHAAMRISDSSYGGALFADGGGLGAPYPFIKPGSDFVPGSAPRPADPWRTMGEGIPRHGMPSMYSPTSVVAVSAVVASGGLHAPLTDQAPAVRPVRSNSWGPPRSGLVFSLSRAAPQSPRVSAAMPVWVPPPLPPYWPVPEGLLAGSAEDAQPPSPGSS
jgi:hypothetical protein